MDEFTLALQFANIFYDSPPHQFHCLVKTLSISQIKIIVTICYNILENKFLNLSPKEKQLLKPHVNIYILLCDRSKSFKFKKEIISRNPLSIRKVLGIVTSINDRV